MTAKKKTRAAKSGLAQLEAEMRSNPLPSAEELAYARSAAAGPDADAEFGVTAPRGRGRPRAGDAPTEGTVTRSIRRPPSAWTRLALAASARGITTHAAMCEALDRWIERVEREQSSPRARKASG